MIQRRIMKNTNTNTLLGMNRYYRDMQIGEKRHFQHGASNCLLQRCPHKKYPVNVKAHQPSALFTLPRDMRIKLYVANGYAALSGILRTMPK